MRGGKQVVLLRLATTNEQQMPRFGATTANGLQNVRGAWPSPAFKYRIASIPETTQLTRWGQWGQGCGPIVFTDLKRCVFLNRVIHARGKTRIGRFVPYRANCSSSRSTQTIGTTNIPVDRTLSSEGHHAKTVRVPLHTTDVPA